MLRIIMHQINALLLSIIIEIPAACFALYLLKKPLYFRGALVAAGSTLLSHPWAWLANTVWLTHLPFLERAFIIEINVIIFEAIFYIWLLL